MNPLMSIRRELGLRLQEVRNSPSFQRSIDHRQHVIELHASRRAETGTFVTFIYEKNSERLLRHIIGTDEDQVILQSLAWSEKNSLTIITEASERLQGASENERSTETGLVQKFQNGLATEEIDSTLEKFCTARRSSARKTQSDRRDPPNTHLATAIVGWMKPGNCDFIGKRGIAKITTAAGRVARDFGVKSLSVNRSIYFPAFVFLLLFTLLLLLSEQFGRFSDPSSMRKSGTAIDQAAVEKAILIDPKTVTKRDFQSDLTRVLTEFRRHLFGVGLFPYPVEINVSPNEERVVSYVHAALKKITRKLRGAQTELKNHVASSFNLKIASRYRPTVNLVTRIHSRPVASYQRRLAHKIGPFVLYRQSIGGAGLFVHKNALATRTNGRSWKKIRSDSRTLEKQLAHFFLSMWRPGRYALGP
jgi:hypothetical protein